MIPAAGAEGSQRAHWGEVADEVRRNGDQQPPAGRQAAGEVQLVAFPHRAQGCGSAIGGL